MKRIVSAVPGRLRIKDGRFGDAKTATDYLARLRLSVPKSALLATRINSQATSIIVRYDASLVAPSELQQQAEKLLDAQHDHLKPHPKRRSRRLRLRINRAAKIGALASLAASMAFAAAGHKRFHVMTGMVFLACLTAHLIVFRRTLLH